MNLSIEKIKQIYELPFNDLIFQAHTVLRQNFDPNQIQVSTLLSIKTGACPEDCKYCPQSGHHKQVKLEKEKLMDVDAVLNAATEAKNNGASRFCMGAAWRNPTAKNLPKVLEIIKAVKGLGLETCATLGMLTKEQALQLQGAGLDYYNHNLDTSEEFYKEIITTRTYQDRLNTLANVRGSGIKVCCGGIIGMGETREDRIKLLFELANLPKHPESVPINQLIAVKGTPLQDTPKLDPLEFIRTIAVARILMPKSFVRLSAGREQMSDEMQALCFFAGANSIFRGDKLLTAANPEQSKEQGLLDKLGIVPMQSTINTEQHRNEYEYS